MLNQLNAMFDPKTGFSRSNQILQYDNQKKFQASLLQWQGSARMSLLALYVFLFIDALSKNISLYDMPEPVFDQNSNKKVIALMILKTIIFLILLCLMSRWYQKRQLYEHQVSSTLFLNHIFPSFHTMKRVSVFMLKIITILIYIEFEMPLWQTMKFHNKLFILEGLKYVFFEFVFWRVHASSNQMSDHLYNISTLAISGSYVLLRTSIFNSTMSDGYHITHIISIFTLFLIIIFATAKRIKAFRKCALEMEIYAKEVYSDKIVANLSEGVILIGEQQKFNTQNAQIFKQKSDNINIDNNSDIRMVYRNKRMEELFETSDDTCLLETLSNCRFASDGMFNRETQTHKSFFEESQEYNRYFKRLVYHYQHNVFLQEKQRSSFYDQSQAQSNKNNLSPFRIQNVAGTAFGMQYVTGIATVPMAFSEDQTKTVQIQQQQQSGLATALTSFTSEQYAAMAQEKEKAILSQMSAAMQTRQRFNPVLSLAQQQIQQNPQQQTLTASKTVRQAYEESFNFINSSSNQLAGPAHVILQDSSTQNKNLAGSNLNLAASSLQFLSKGADECIINLETGGRQRKVDPRWLVGMDFQQKEAQAHFLTALLLYFLKQANLQMKDTIQVECFVEIVNTAQKDKQENNNNVGNKNIAENAIQNNEFRVKHFNLTVQFLHREECGLLASLILRETTPLLKLERVVKSNSLVIYRQRSALNCLNSMLNLLLPAQKKETMLPLVCASDAFEGLNCSLQDTVSISLFRFSPQFADFDLFQLCKEVVTLAKIKGDLRGVTVLLDYDIKLCSLTQSDRSRLKRVLWVLLENLLSISEAGKLTLKTEIDKYYDNKYIHFQIKANANANLTQQMCANLNMALRVRSEVSSCQTLQPFSKEGLSELVLAQSLIEKLSSTAPFHLNTGLTLKYNQEQEEVAFSFMVTNMNINNNTNNNKFYQKHQKMQLLPPTNMSHLNLPINQSQMNNVNLNTSLQSNRLVQQMQQNQFQKFGQSSQKVGSLSFIQAYGSNQSLRNLNEMIGNANKAKHNESLLHTSPNAVTRLNASQLVSLQTMQKTKSKMLPNFKFTDDMVAVYNATPHMNAQNVNFRGEVGFDVDEEVGMKVSKNQMQQLQENQNLNFTVQDTNDLLNLVFRHNTSLADKRPLDYSYRKINSQLNNIMKQSINQNNLSFLQCIDNNNNTNTNNNNTNINEGYINDNTYEEYLQQKLAFIKRMQLLRLTRKCICSEVLIVADDDFDSSALSHYLETYTLFVDIAHNTQQAIAKVQQRMQMNSCCVDYKILFIDDLLPQGKSGGEVVEQMHALYDKQNDNENQNLNQIKSNKLTPILIKYSGDPFCKREIILNQMFADVLVKPINKDKLLDILIQHLNIVQNGYANVNQAEDYIEQQKHSFEP